MSDDYKREDIALKLREVAAAVGAVVHKVRVIPGKQLPQTLAQFAAADLRNAIELVDVCTSEQIPPDFLDIFKDATVTSMAGQTNLETKVVHQEVGTSSHVLTNTGFASMIKIEGASVEGAAIVTMNEDTLLKIMSTVLGAPQTSANEAVTNGVAELVNLVCGRAKGTLNELGYDVKLASLPVTKDSPEFIQAMARMQNGQAAKITFQTPEGEFALELRFAPRKGASA
jgi:CheY-specific phosphatase CheX